MVIILVSAVSRRLGEGDYTGIVTIWVKPNLHRDGSRYIMIDFITGTILLHH